MLKIICCTKSHLRAIEYAYRDESPEYSIILEDDVTFNNNFNEIIKELIYKWETNSLYSEIEMLNIGWIPCNNYNHYVSYEYIPFDVLSNNTLFNYFYSVGLQGYIIKKSKINNDIKFIISSDTFVEYSLKVFDKSTVLRNMNKQLNSTCAIDNVLNKLLNFAVVFPPIIIERDEPSTLGHNNKNDYWDKYFKNNEEKINDYM
jgi:GR25 family glycosyltransferase involved in LPS biosynthesis